MISLAGALVFWTMLLCNCVVAFACGHALERRFSAMLIAFCVFTPMMQVVFDHRDWGFNIALWSDWVILVIAWSVALRSDRYWPLWFAGLQTLTVLSGALSWSDFDMRHRIFANLSAFWSLPALVIMSWGTVLDRRQRMSAAPASAG